ncbi:hypothetical protein G4177_21785 [Corallococcus sp. ZKHCc1 1396]|uniref:Uncharacterized protein n=1 Tax=Corallococcus soli TaxID=2710757 RepID=A0ABR9PSC9_9BACT|nr:hypothetical protein [Corallococcus soli]
MSVDDHLEATRSHELHVEGEANGCLLRCFKYGKDDPKGTKGHSHRVNGRIYQEQAENSRYNLDFTTGENRQLLERIFGERGPECVGGDPRLRAEAWHMGDGANFCHARAPWPNVGHHVVPINTIGKVFAEPSELNLLLQAKYNVNRGVNIVLLPYSHAFGQAMRLPVHRGGHPSYDAQIETKLRSIHQKIKKAKDPQRAEHPELPKENVPGITADIENFAKQLRRFLLDGSSKFRHGPSVNDFRFPSFR